MREKPNLPDGSLRGDADGDGQDSLVEFALGSDPRNGADLASIKTTTIEKNGEIHLQLEFTLRSDSFGLTAEIQQSIDGRNWRSIGDAFELVEKTPQGEGLVRVKLVPKKPKEVCGFFRIAVAGQ